MANIRKIGKGVKKLTNKQKTYQIRGAENKREKELEERGGKASPEFVAKLKKKTFKEIERKTGKPIVKKKFY